MFRNISIKLLIVLSFSYSQEFYDVEERYDSGDIKTLIKYDLKDQYLNKKTEYHFYLNGNKKYECSYELGKVSVTDEDGTETGRKQFYLKNGLEIGWYYNEELSPGSKKYQRSFKNSVEDGLQTEWYENGQKSIEQTWRSGIRHGQWTHWYDSGEKLMLETYKNGVLIKYSYLNKDGSVKEPINVSNLDQIDKVSYTRDTNKPYFGPVFSLHKNGGKRYEGSLKKGRFHGLSNYWYESGKKKQEGLYRYGLRDGLWTSWYENGKKRYKGTWKNGEKDGLSTTWYENGKKRGETNYKNGLRDGFETYWYENGQKEFEGTWKDGKEIFENTKRWNEDGSLRTEPFDWEKK